LDRRGRAAGESAKILATAEAGRFGQRVEPLQITQAIDSPQRSRGSDAAHRPARSALALSEEIGGPIAPTVHRSRPDFPISPRAITAAEAGDARTKTALAAKADQAKRSRWLKKRQSGRRTDLVEGQSLDNPGWNATL